MKLKEFIKLASDPYIWCEIYDNYFGMKIFHNSISDIPNELLECTLVSWEIRETEIGPEMIFNLDKTCNFCMPVL